MRKFILFLWVVVAGVASAGERFSFPYVYKYGTQAHLRSSGERIEEIVRISKRWTGEFVWLRKDGREWLIRDPGVLAQVRAAFAEMHAFEPRLRAAEEKRRPVERKREAIEDRMDRLSDQLDDDSLTEKTRESIEARLRQAERELEAMEDEYEAVERAAEALEREMERLEKIAERKFGEIVLRAIAQGKARRVDS